jgi:hypothetical protein
MLPRVLEQEALIIVHPTTIDVYSYSLDPPSDMSI